MSLLVHVRRVFTPKSTIVSAVQLENKLRLTKESRRCLFSAEVLGIENFKRQRSNYNDKMGDLKEAFCGRMKEYMDASEKNTIFTDDLKSIVHLAERSTELDISDRMIQRYQGQREDLRFSSFTFGPVVMRMYHLLNQADRALAMFNDESLGDFFDQMSSYMALMDLLFENNRHQEVLDVLDLVTQRQLGGFKFPMDCVTLACASCLRLNTPESLERVLKLFRDIREGGAFPSGRSIVYAAVLAVKQEQPETALELLSISRDNIQKQSLAHINAKLLVLTRLRRVEDAFILLRHFLQKDDPDHVVTGGEVFQEILTEIGEVVNASDNKENKTIYERISSALQQENHMNQLSFEQYIFRPVMRKRRLQDGFKQRQRSSVGGHRREYGAKNYFPRPGLRDSDDQSSQ